MMMYLLMGSFVLAVIALLIRNRRLRHNVSHVTRLIEQHVEEVETMYRQMRGIRHDYRNQLQVLKTHHQLGQLDALSDYLDQLEHELNTVDTIVQSGNVAVDAIVNSKLTLARQRGISLHAKAIVPSDLPITSVDMGILIGNLLSNAYEAALKSPDPFIRLYIAPIKGSLYINCTNSTRGKVREFLSTKIGLEHGFGITRIDQIVKKYDGWLSRASEEGVFSSEITLPLMPKTEPLVRE